MERYHYLGAGPLCGAQMRYVIRSKRHGLLGGLSFSAAAWRVSARDRYIGCAPRPPRRALFRGHDPVDSASDACGGGFAFSVFE